MASFQAGPDLVLHTTTIGVMLTMNAQGQLVMQKKNNNYSALTRTRHADLTLNNRSFGPVDEQVRQLDARFEIIPTQDDWEFYAANIAGRWTPCVNCKLESSGKKLYRQYNMNRARMGLDYVDVPVDDTAYEAAQVTQLEIQDSNNPGAVFATANVIGSFDFTAIIANVGKGMANPLLQGDEEYVNTVFTRPDAGYDWALSVADAAGVLINDGAEHSRKVQWCTWNADGAPGFSTQANVIYQFVSF